MIKGTSNRHNAMLELVAISMLVQCSSAQQELRWYIVENMQTKNNEKQQ